MASKAAKVTLLHLSDLHIRKDDKEKIDRGMVLDPLLERLETDYKKDLRPELVVVTGDIAFQGIQDEYELASPFLNDLLKVLHLNKECLYLVPGNHDVYRKAYRPTEVPRYDTNREINEELSNADYRADLLKGMKHYFGFVQANFPHLTSEHGNLVPFVDRIKSETGYSLGLVGLNSAWMCRACKPGEDDSGRIAIGEHQIKSAFSELQDKGVVDVALVMFHHPLRWLAPMDRRICERYLDQTISLAGHLHEPGGGYAHRFSTQMAHIQAGGAYLGSDSDWPSRYHYLGIDLDKARLRFDFRSFSASKHLWIVDTEIGDDAGAAVISADFLLARAKTSSADVPLPELPEFPEAYAVWLMENFGYLEAEKLNPKGKATPLSLPELYVPLFGADPIAVRPDADESSRIVRPAGVRSSDGEIEKLEDPGIETLVAKYNTLLINGQAGSGKSTLIKHLAYTLSPSTEKHPASVELSDYLPVLILLKDLQVYCHRDVNKEDRTCSVGEEMLEWYVKNRLSGTLEMETIGRFAKSGRLLLLVDGLDEIDRPLRDHAVNALADVLIPHAENKIVLAGRPHGLEGVPQNRFGKFTTSIKDLSPDQVQRFIRQWFDYFYPGTAGVGKKTAEEMLSGVKDHPDIEQLTVNPLMLTAICLLYLDNKELPDQRAELFKKFIDNMIWRRFDDPEPRLDQLKRLAYEMHSQRVRMADKSTAVDAISKTVVPNPEEKASAFRRRMEKRFDQIEPQCGLLVKKEGQTGFWHLAFQESLTAQHLMDTFTDSHAAIAAYWSDDWYKEVVELYVSYLSIEYKQTANDIIYRVVKAKDASPYRRWRLAGRTLVDFHASRRSPEVVTKVRERLKLIIEKPLESTTLVDAGETLGWLGDDRDLESFAPVDGGEYDLEKTGKETIEAFEMGRYPVTNQFFRRFVDENGYTTEAFWTEMGKEWLRSRSQRRQPRTWQNRKYRCPNQPVTGVCWYEAAAFCRWLSVNDSQYQYFLPSESQWQAAAAGREQREYPWGGDQPFGRCNYNESKIGRPSPVGIYADGCTPENKDAAIYDMAGNVFEWTCTNSNSGQSSDDFVFDEDWGKMKDAGFPIIKGGSWGLSAEYARCASRSNFYSPVARLSDVGFRCARTKK